MALAVLKEMFFVFHSVWIDSGSPCLVFSGYWEVFPQEQSDWVVTVDLHVAASVAITSTPPCIFMAWCLMK
jgi:hypothetical protein